MFDRVNQVFRQLYQTLINNNLIMTLKTFCLYNLLGKNDINTWVKTANYLKIIIAI